MSSFEYKVNKDLRFTAGEASEEMCDMASLEAYKKVFVDSCQSNEEKQSNKKKIQIETDKHVFSLTD